MDQISVRMNWSLCGNMTADQPINNNRNTRLVNRDGIPLNVHNKDSKLLKLQSSVGNAITSSPGPGIGGYSEKISVTMNGIDIHKFNRICRDYTQGHCRRLYCRYPHVVSPESVIFCHDFQNSTCPRVNCKFLHYTLEEEDYYRKFSKFPQNSNEIANNDSLSPNACSDMLMHGQCRHRECQYVLLPPAGSTAGTSASCPRRLDCDQQKWSDRSMMYRGNYNSTYDNNLRPHNEYQQSQHSEYITLKRPGIIERYEPFKRFRDDTESSSPSSDVMSILRRFEEEHNMLRRRVEANEVKIAELRASNDYLMSQNAQIRLSNAQQCSRVVNPVTVTTSQPQATQVINAVSMAPVQVQATPIVSIAAPQTQIIASSSCAPLAITANTSQGQQLALAQQSMSTLSTTAQPMNAAHASQILGTSQITLTPTLATAPSMGLTINTSQALAMSNATQPIISYPVMTHSILPH